MAAAMFCTPLLDAGPVRAASGSSQAESVSANVSQSSVQRSSVIKISSFEGYKPGTPYKTVNVKIGTELSKVPLPQNIPIEADGNDIQVSAETGNRASDYAADNPSRLADGNQTLFASPLVWNASAYDDSKEGTYRIYLVIVSSNYEYDVSDNVLTFWKNEAELPYIDVTVTSDASLLGSSTDSKVEGSGTSLTSSVKKTEVKDDNGTARITVSGKMPESSYLSVTSVAKKDAVEMLGATASKNHIVSAYDIKVYYTDTDNRIKEYEPGPEAPLSVSINSDAFDSSKDTEVYHVKEHGIIDAVNTDASGSSVRFKAESFSTYVVTESQKLLNASAGTTWSGYYTGSFNIWCLSNGWPIRANLDQEGSYVKCKPYQPDSTEDQTTVYWSVIKAGTEGEYIISNGLANTGSTNPTPASSYVLAVDSTTNPVSGDKLKLESINTNGAYNERWYIQANSDGTLTFSPRRDSSLAIDVLSAGLNAERTASQVDDLQIYTKWASDTASARAQKFILTGNINANGTENSQLFWRTGLKHTTGDHFVSNMTNIYYFNSAYGGLMPGYRRGGEDYVQSSVQTSYADDNTHSSQTTVDNSKTLRCFDNDTLACVKNDVYYDASSRPQFYWESKNIWFYCDSNGKCVNTKFSLTTQRRASKPFASAGAQDLQTTYYSTSVSYGTAHSGFTADYNDYPGILCEASIEPWSATSIGGYQKLSDALNNYSSGDNIYLLRHDSFFDDVTSATINFPVTITTQSDVTDGVYFYNTGSAFTNTSTLTLAGTGSAYLYIDGNSTSGHRGVTNTGALTLDTGVCIQNQYVPGEYGAGVYSSSGGSVTISGGTIKNSSSGDAAGVFVASGTFEMTSGSITGNSSSTGAGIYLSGGTGHVLSGGTISGNSGTYGSAIFIGLDTTLSLSGSPTISGNIEELSTSSLIHYPGSYSGSTVSVQCAEGVYNSLVYTPGREVATRRLSSYQYGDYEYNGSSASSGSGYITSAGAYYTYGYGNGIYLASSFSVTFIDYTGTTKTTRNAVGYIGADGTLNGTSITIPSENTSSYGSSSGWTTDTSSAASAEYPSMGGTVTLSKSMVYYGLYAGTVTDTFKDAVTTQTVSASIARNSYSISSGAASSSATVPAESSYAGWTTDGWTSGTSADASSSLTAGTSYVPSGNTYYGLYSQNVTLLYDSDGGSSTPAAQTGTRKVNASSLSVPSSPTFTLAAAITKENNEFQGWTISAPISAVKAAGDRITPDSGTDITAKALWKSLGFAITYTLNGGTNSASNPSIYTDEMLPFVLAAPVKDGWTFTGWTGSNGTDPEISVTIPSGTTGALAYTAHWTRNITLTMISGTDKASTKTLTYVLVDSETGHDFTPSSASGVTGYRFIGWNLDDKAGVPAYADGDKVNISDNTTIYAVYDKTVTAVCVDYLGKDQKTRQATGTKYYNTSGTSADAHVLIPEEESYRADVTNAGWTASTEPDATAPIPAAGQSVSLSEDTTYYGLYSKDVTVKFIDYVDTAKREQSVHAGMVYANSYDITNFSSLSITTPEEGVYTGWTIRGWTMSSDADAAIKKASGATYKIDTFDDVFYGEYKQDVVLKYVANGGETTPSTQTESRYVNSCAIETIKHPSFTLSKAIRNGYYNFGGWDVSAPVSAVKDALSVITPESGTLITATAQWTIEHYSISYDLAGGEPGGDNPTDYTSATEDFELIPPTKTGYEFAGWTGSNGDTPQKDLVIATGNSGDKSYVANWTPIDYVITFDKNTGNGEMPPETMTFDSSSTLTPNSFTKQAYTFIGWNTKADGTGTAYDDKAEVKNLSNEPGSTYPLYAQWKATGYIVHFNAGDGKGTMDDQVIDEGKETALDKNEFTLKGFAFEGWDTDPSGKTVVYTDGQDVTDIAEAGTSIQLYAVWKMVVPTGIDTDMSFPKAALFMGLLLAAVFSATAVMKRKRR